jgi:hypothetical protein
MKNLLFANISKRRSLSAGVFNPQTTPALAAKLCRFARFARSRGLRF